jgi:hypothetical protein
MTTTSRWQPDLPADLKPIGFGRRARIAVVVWAICSLAIVGWVVLVPPSPSGGGPDCGTTVAFDGPDAVAQEVSRDRACNLAEQGQRWLAMWGIAAIGVGAVISTRIRRWRPLGEMEPHLPDPEELRAPEGFRERALMGPTEPTVDGTPPRPPI